MRWRPLSPCLTFGVFGLALLACAPSALAARYNDEITLATAGGGQIVRGEVVKESMEKVEARDDRGQRMPDFIGASILKIKWDIPGSEWQRGVEELEEGRYEAAAVSFKVCVDDPAFRPVARACLLLNYGIALHRSGSSREAAEALESLTKDHATSRYYPEAVGRLIQVYIDLKNWSPATKLLEKMPQLGPDYALQAELYQGEIAFNQGKYDEAAQRFGKAAVAQNPEVQAESRLGQARCAVAKKDYDRARQAAQQALSGRPSKRIAATAHLILGNVLYEQAITDIDARRQDAAQEKLLDAVLEYLWIWTLYPDDERTEPEALVKAGHSFALLAKIPGRKTDRRRAAEIYAKAIEKYPGSRWSKDAREELKKIQ